MNEGDENDDYNFKWKRKGYCYAVGFFLTEAFWDNFSEGEYQKCGAAGCNRGAVVAEKLYAEDRR